MNTEIANKTIIEDGLYIAIVENGNIAHKYPLSPVPAMPMAVFLKIEEFYLAVVQSREKHKSARGEITHNEDHNATQY